MLRLRRGPAKSQRKVVLKDQLHCWRSLDNWVVHLQILMREGLANGKKEHWDQKHAVKFSTSTWHQRKIRERKGPSRGIFPKCAPHECSLCVPKFGRRSHEEILHQERCARIAARELAKIIYKFKNSDKAAFYIPIEATVMPSSVRRDQRSENSQSIQEHPCTWWAKKYWAQMKWILDENPGTPLWCLQTTMNCIQMKKRKFTYTI